MDKSTKNPFSEHIKEITCNDKKFKYFDLPSLKDPRISKKLSQLI